MTTISKERLLQLFDYDPETGLLHRKIYRSSLAMAGEIAGSKNKLGYIRISIDGIPYQAHRLIWIICHGSIDPKLQIDHINGVRDDNRIVNLRLVTPRINAQNVRHSESHNKYSCPLGVGYRKSTNKFRAQITFGGRQIFLGSFSNAEDAHAAYVEAKRTLHEGNTL